MPQIKIVILIGILSLLSPSVRAEDRPANRFLESCAKMLINSGLWHSKPRAVIHNTHAQVENLNGLFVVRIEGVPGVHFINRTDRDLFEMIHADPSYPVEFLRPGNLRGLKVADIACGNGALVNQLRARGVDIVGLDFVLTPYQMSRPYFVKASAHDTGFADKTFDVVMTSRGPFYYLDSSPEYIQSLYREMHRILKPGGVLRISGLDLKGDFRQVAPQPLVDLQGTGYWPIPSGFRIKSYPDQLWFLSNPEDTSKVPYWIELERID